MMEVFDAKQIFWDDEMIVFPLLMERKTLMREGKLCLLEMDFLMSELADEGMESRLSCTDAPPLYFPPRGERNTTTNAGVRVAVLIPDRNDRPEFLKNCLRMVEAQSLQPVHVELVNDVAVSERCDITWRYRIGYDRLRGKNFDVIALMENDDWYHPDYLKTMAEKWVAFGKPDILGTGYTIYYHLRLRAWFVMEHYRRASAMNTFIKPDLNFEWCADHEAYTDLHLWKLAKGNIHAPAVLRGVVFKPERHIAIGMKHGSGLCGGLNHTDRLGRFKFVDSDLSFLREHLDARSFEFYTSVVSSIDSTVPVAAVV